MKYRYMQISDADIQVIDGDRGTNYPHQDELYKSGHCLFLSAKNVTENGFDFKDNLFISEEKDNVLRNGKIQRGDIVITTRGTVGNVALYSDDIPYKNIRINSGMLIIRCGKMVNNYFIYHVMRSKWFYNQIISIQSGTAQPQLPKSHFLKMYIILPDMAIQSKIAMLLSIIDDKIELNQKINDNLERQAQALFQHMFIDNHSSEWVEGKLSDIADITMGQSPSGNSYNENGVGTIFFQGRAEFGSRFPTVRLYTTEPKRMACENDVLLSVRAPVGDLNVAHTDCCIGRGLAAIHSKFNHQSFVLYTMHSLKKQLDVFNGEGTVFGSINRNSLNDMPITIPNKEAVDEFEKTVSPMDAHIRNNFDEICRLQQIRDALLPKLMSGELDVSNLEI